MFLFLSYYSLHDSSHVSWCYHFQFIFHDQGNCSEINVSDVSSQICAKFVKLYLHFCHGNSYGLIDVCLLQHYSITAV